MDMETETDMETEMDSEKEMDIGGHGHRIWELLLSISYGAIVPIAPYGMSLKYHVAIFNGAIYL
jgi:hypothetical protein